jgi:hypothetical protein
MTPENLISGEGALGSGPAPSGLYAILEEISGLRSEYVSSCSDLTHSPPVIPEAERRETIRDLSPAPWPLFTDVERPVPCPASASAAIT